MLPLLLASGKNITWAIIAAGILILLLLFFILKPLTYGMLDIVRYYKNKEARNNRAEKFFDNISTYLLTFIILFPPLAFGGVDSWAVVALELSILCLFFIFILKSIKSGVIEFKKNTLNLLFILFILYLVFQILFKTTKLPYNTFLTLKTVSIYFGLFIVIVNSVRSEREIDSIIFKLMLAGLTVSLVGILQQATGTDKIYWIRKPYAPVSFATFTYWNHFACYISMVALISFGSLCANMFKNIKSAQNLTSRKTLFDIMDNVLKGRTLFMLFSFAIMAMALFLSKSRSGIIFFLAGFIFFISFILRRKYPKKFVAALTLGLVAIYILSLGFSGIVMNVDLKIGEILRELGTVLSSGEYVFRATLYTIDAPKIFKDYPFFGIGLSSLYHVFPSYLSVIHTHGWGHTPGVYSVSVVPRYMFNDPLQLLIEAGLIGFIILLTPFAIFLMKFFKNIGAARDDYKYLVGMGLISSYLFLGLHTQIDFDFSLSSISSLFVILLSLSLLTANLGSVKDDSEIEKNRIVTLKTKESKMGFYIFSTVIFVYFALVVSRPIIVNFLTRDAATVDSYKKALALDSRNADIHYKYHKFMLEQYKKRYITKEVAFREAGAAINKAIKLNPYETGYLMTKGDFELLQKNYEEAANFYRKAAFAGPSNPVIQMGYAVTLFWQAIHEKYIMRKKDRLLKKGLIYYSKARILSDEQINLDSIIKNKKALSFLKENLNKEGLDLR
jgi:hypothetical protein